MDTLTKPKKTPTVLITKSIPEAKIKYMENMGGVDRQDQLLSYISWPFKTYKWRVLVTIHLLQKPLINAFILYKELHPKQ
jgi:hypothetical protein